MTARLPLPIAVSLALLAGCSPRPAPDTAAPPLRAVRIAAVSRGPAEPPVQASGLAASRDQTTLAFKVGGVIAAVEVREGDAVRAGQRLARIEAAEVDAAVAQAREALAKAGRDLARGRTLFAADVVTREQLDDLGTAEAVARAQLDAAQFNRRHAEIIAPADGRVLARHAEPRELVAAGSPVLTVSASGSGTVLEVGLADRDALRVAVGDRADVRFDALPDRRFAAKVQEIARASDPRTGTWRCQLAVDTGDAGLPAFTGLIGRARITPASSLAATRSYLPVAALVEGDQDKARLYLFDPSTGTVHSREPRIAFLSGDTVALAEPLPDGSQVVTEGAAYLHDGETVQVIAGAAP
ncbi:efflux RND transporter periplasmic adaptor subunit [Nevskia sp.]|uniref:efflux RND transporter periplasmic adaptor subunit n=1 Tax=Nevskia sp. TaxID=1929292 RepID=UPI003F6F4212